jgi:molybdenum cofactor cytidylyltransferase
MGSAGVTREADSTMRTGSVHALVLAGGAGSRLGGGKLRRPWRGRPLLLWALESALAAPVESMVLVTGADPGLADVAPDDPRLRTVVADEWAQGLSASLRAGLAALPPDAGAALVFLGDMPRLPPDVAGPLVAAWRAGAVAAAPAWAGERGHPALLDRSLFAEAAAATGDRGAGPLLKALGARLVTVPAGDDGVLYDVDTPDRLEP